VRCGGINNIGVELVKHYLDESDVPDHPRAAGFRSSPELLA
jgi:hypothetical protein